MSGFVRGLVGIGLLSSTGLAHAEPSSSAPAAAAPELRVYMRSEGQPLTFSARERRSSGEPTWCVAPCNAALRPGEYQLRLNGVLAESSLNLNKPGTLHGAYHSREAGRSGGWLALNVGGILGGVFITVGALGGPSWAYIAGGGSLAAGGVIFVLTYRADTASVSFSPNEPADVRGMPEPASRASALDSPERARLAAQTRGLGFRVAF
jgi:hypothetical protein